MSDRKRWMRIWLKEQGFSDPEDVRVRDYNGTLLIEFKEELPDEVFERLRKVLKEKSWTAWTTIYDNTGAAPIELPGGDDDEE